MPAWASCATPHIQTNIHTNVNIYVYIYLHSIRLTKHCYNSKCTWLINHSDQRLMINKQTNNSQRETHSFLEKHSKDSEKWSPNSIQSNLKNILWSEQLHSSIINPTLIFYTILFKQSSSQTQELADSEA